MQFKLPALLALAASLFSDNGFAQNPRNVQVTAYHNRNNCGGAKDSKMVAVDNECRRFNARSYRVNKEDEDCVLVTFSDRQCQNRLTRREFDRKDRENDDDDEDEDEACERLPQRARSYRVRCSNDDEDNDNEDEEDD